MIVRLILNSSPSWRHISHETLLRKQTIETDVDVEQLNACLGFDGIWQNNLSHVTPKIDYSGIHPIKRNDIDMKDF